MKDPGNKAVLLKHSSQDGDAARSLCEALRSGGVEVWFDADGGLEHGDEWDAKIRRQIKECVLFIPVISANTQAREEGYFRLEWDLAAERARTIASGVPFILPVVIDETREPEALVPDRFRAVQWTRLRGGEVSPDVLQRLLKLWSHRTGVLKYEAARASAAPIGAVSSAAGAIGKPRAKNYALAAVAFAVVVAGAAWWLLGRRSGSAKPPSPPVAAVAPTNSLPAAVPLSEARQLVRKARALLEAIDSTREDFALADDLLKQAIAKDGADAEVWACVSQLNRYYIVRGWEMSDQRRDAALTAAQRASRLDPQSYEARLAQIGVAGNTPREVEDAERDLRQLRREKPDDRRVLRSLSGVLRKLNRSDEADAISDEAAALPGGDPLALYNKAIGAWLTGRTAAAEAALHAAIAQKPFSGALLLGGWFKIILHGDLDGALAEVKQVPAWEFREDRGAYVIYKLHLLRREPGPAIDALRNLPRDWLNDTWYRGPKGRLIGNALQLAGRADAARAEWQVALKLVETRLAAAPTDGWLLYNRALLLADLGDREEAARQAVVLYQRFGLDGATETSMPIWATHLFTALDRRAEAIQEIRRGLKQPRHAVDFTAAILRLDPRYDALRGEPEFAKVIAEAEAFEQGARLSSATTHAPAEKSVAVLALENLSDDKENEYFSDGISEELLNALAQVPGLRVVGRTSAFYFKGKNATAQEIGQKLNVAHLVEGSVRRAGTKVRIMARLSKTETGEQIWSEAYERELKDIFALQDEIAGLIAKALQLKLGAAPRMAKAVNPEVHRLILEGRHFWRQRTDDGFARAETDFSKAVKLDPLWAPAHAALADLWAIRALYRLLDGAPFERELVRARAAATRALELDADLAEPHGALGMVSTIEGRVAEARRHFDQALALAPNHAAVRDWLGDLMQSTGRLDLALQEYRTAAQLDPLSPYILTDLGRTLPLARRFGDALEMLEQAEPLQPGRVRLGAWRAYVLLELGRRQEAGAALQAVLPKLRSAGEDGGEVGWLVVYVLRALGRDPEARDLGARLLQAMKDDRSQGALLRFALGEEAQALALIARAPNTTTIAQYLFWHPMFDAIRDQPRFHQLLAKVGRAEQYQVARETLARMLKLGDAGQTKDQGPETKGPRSHAK